MTLAKTCAAALAAILATGCRQNPKVQEEEPPTVVLDSPALGEGLSENFEGAALDKQVWRATSGGYAIEDGALRAKNCRNRPL